MSSLQWDPCGITLQVAWHANCCSCKLQWTPTSAIASLHWKSKYLRSTLQAAYTGTGASWQAALNMYKRDFFIAVRSLQSSCRSVMPDMQTVLVAKVTLLPSCRPPCQLAMCVFIGSVCPNCLLHSRLLLQSKCLIATKFRKISRWMCFATRGDLLAAFISVDCSIPGCCCIANECPDFCQTLQNLKMDVHLLKARSKLAAKQCTSPEKPLSQSKGTAAAEYILKVEDTCALPQK